MKKANKKNKISDNFQGKQAHIPGINSTALVTGFNN